MPQAEWLIGGPFDDSLTGSEASDAIFGADGNDTIDALGEDDAPAGGGGDDAVDGGSGFDFMPNYSLPVYYGFPPPGSPMTIDLPAGTLTGDGTDALDPPPPVAAAAFGRMGWSERLELEPGSLHTVLHSIA